MALFAIGFAYALSRLIAWERDGPLNQLGFVTPGSTRSTWAPTWPEISSLA